MDREELKRIIDTPPNYDETRGDTLFSMIGQLYSRDMADSFIVHGIYSLPFIAGAIFCGIKFFWVDSVRSQIMHATIFVCCVQFIIFSKNKYWQMLHKRNISREIKRLELHIAELGQKIEKK